MDFKSDNLVSLTDVEFVVCLGCVLVTSILSWVLSGKLILYQSGKRLLPCECQKLSRRLEAMDRLVLIPFSLIQGTLAMFATLEFEQKNQEGWIWRWQDSSGLAKWVITLYVVKTGIFDVVAHLVTILQQSENKRIGILFHHILSGFFMGIAIFHSGTCHYFACLAIISESTTFFLNNIMATKLFLGEHTKSQKLFVAINGVLLWLSYLACRLLLFPYWFYLWFSDALTYDISFISLFQQITYPATVGLIFFLSLFWFYLITRGLLRAILKTSSSSERKSA